MESFHTPTDWKSAIWWRNRSVEERLFHLHVPKRVQRHIDGSSFYYELFSEEWDMDSNLFIQGSSGSGKSYAAARTLIEIVRTKSVSGRWIEADEYIEMLKDSFSNDGLLPEMYSSPHLVKYLKGTFDVVVIDGLGEERLTEFASHELGSLIRKRYDQNKSTIITSRLSLQDIKNRYGARLANPLSDFQHEVRRARQ